MLLKSVTREAKSARKILKGSKEKSSSPEGVK
jgi:hypothetical protein